MQSVSDNIMLGQLAPLGTGAFTLLLDEAALEDAVDVSLLDFDREFGGGMTPGVPFLTLSMTGFMVSTGLIVSTDTYGWSVLATTLPPQESPGILALLTVGWLTAPSLAQRRSFRSLLSLVSRPCPSLTSLYPLSHENQEGSHRCK